MFQNIFQYQHLYLKVLISGYYLLNNLNEIPGNCKDVYFTVFGLSLATLNVIISLIIVVMSILLIKYEKNR